ncbi:MAG: NAD(+)/NADH kinase [Lachnospiraceae bacterium]|nr:NAD(+)/NADH kinase [Lachnospiraceae bacterium]
MDNFLLIVNQLKDPDGVFTRRAEDILRREGRKVRVIVKETEDQIDESLLRDEDECVVVLGGDGTVLRAVRDLRRRPLPILGINLGTLGYLTETDRSGMEEALQRTASGDYEVEERMMLCGSMGDRQEDALNDIVITRMGKMRMLSYRLYIGGHFLNTIQADGIIISTPTGSTAYNLSAGGPIIEPTARMILITPICSHTLGNRSIVISAEREIRIELAEDARRAVYTRAEAVFDGAAYCEMEAGDSIVIRESEAKVRLVRLGDRSFLETLHRKMTDI